METFKNYFYKLFTLMTRIVLIFEIINDFRSKDNYCLSVGLAAILLTFLPKLVEKVLKKNNKLISFLFMLFIFLASYLGTLRRFYAIFPWWDFAVHLLSGIILGLIAFCILKDINIFKNTESIKFRIFALIFIISFATLCGVLWEIYEFTMDNILGADMQVVELTGVADTMGDLIADFIGGAIIGIYGFTAFKNKTNFTSKYTKNF
jgi:hypothetical protein